MSTEVGLLLILVIGLLLEFWTFKNARARDTMSEVVRKAAKKLMIVPFSAGMLMGHWFWPLTDADGCKESFPSCTPCIEEELRNEEDLKGPAADRGRDTPARRLLPSDRDTGSPDPGQPESRDESEPGGLTVPCTAIPFPDPLYVPHPEPHGGAATDARAADSGSPDSSSHPTPPGLRGQEEALPAPMRALFRAARVGRAAGSCDLRSGPEALVERRSR
jgi:hypothetical protein